MRFLLALAAAVFPASALAAGTATLGPCPPGFIEAPQSASGPVTIVEGRTGGNVACMPAPPLRSIEPVVQATPFPVRDFRDPMPVDAGVLRLVSLNPRSPTELAQQTSTRVLTRTYDDFDRVKTETVPLEDGGSATIRYTYWRDGLRKTMTDAFGRVTFYEYDGQARLSRVTANQGLADEQVTTYTYWPDDLLKTITAPNGVLTSYGYDFADRVTSIDIARGAVSLLSYAYTYDANGNRLSQIETNGGVPELTTYTYDQRDRLVTVTYPSGTSVEYVYDEVSNRTGEIERDPSGTIVSNKTAVFDAINRLTSVADSVDPSNDATFTYDANGNLTSKTTAAGTETYDYDPRDLMVEARKGTAVVARYAYDAFGRRYLKVSSEGAFTSVVRQYLYDQTSLLHELDSDDLEIAKYEYGGDRLTSLVRRDEPRRFYHQDALGSVVALSDSAGAVVGRYHLDAWGRYRAPSELDASANRFGFTGYLFDQETALYYAKARFYDPTVGRFTSQDSFLGEIDAPPSLHRYFYAHANPLRFIDPTGHAVRVIEGDPRRTGFTVTPEGYTEALTYETNLTVTDQQPAAYALPQMTGRIVAPANTLANGAARIPLNMITVGGASGIERAVHEGNASLSDPASLATAYTEGNANALTFGGVDAYVDARSAEGKGVGASLLAGGKGAALNALPIAEGRTLLDENASGSDMAKAVGVGALKVVGLTALGRGAVGGRGALKGAVPAVVEEGATANVQLRILNPHFLPASETKAAVKYIGKMDDLSGIPRSQTLLDNLPNLGSPRANYYQNASVLRKAVRDGFKIRDASAYRLSSDPDPTLLRPDRTIGQSFLGAERLILGNKGLTLSPDAEYVLR
jgi:RHS repeat-associated protein